VVGCTDATKVVPDGACVRVDGTTGEAEVVE
jgi:phosphohistidine swiveling domain-containing protein